MIRRAVALAGLFVAAVLGGFFIATPESVHAARPACLCQCDPEWDPEPQWRAFTTGNPDCRADCSQACGGAANLISPTSTGRLVTVACVPGQSSDCRTGAYSIYQGVTCAVQYDTGNANALRDWPETGGQKPVCVLPIEAITIENANRECATYGGIAKVGGVCGVVARDEDPNGFIKSRPKLGATGQDYTSSYSYSSWRQQMDSEHPGNIIRADDGLCYRYGVLFGLGSEVVLGGQGSANIQIGGNSSVSFTPTGNATNEYVCLKRRRDECGRVARPFQPGLDVPLNANAYSCQNTQDVSARGQTPLSTFCWGNSATLCAASPGMACCLGGQGGIGGCRVNTDCGPGKFCNTSGNCVTNPVCDPVHNDPIPSGSQAWQVDQRRCRNATPVEKANPDICTLPIVSGSPSACPNPSQTCCRAANPNVTSGCASDFILRAGGNANFNDFRCMNATEIPSTQMDPQTGTINTLSWGPEQWDNYNPAGATPHCLGTTVLQRDANGRVTGTVPRCGSQQFCCNAVALRVPDPVVRVALGAPCGTTENRNAGFRCLDMDEVLPSEQDALNNFGLTRDEYLSQLANGKCQITPYDGNVLYSTQECVAEAFCCSQSARTPTPCDTDDDCRSFSNPARKCDLTIHACIDAALVDAARNSASCYDRAEQQGADIASISNANGTLANDFTCQFVTANTPEVGGKCVVQGCDNVGVPAGSEEGTTAQCCIPGTGQSPGAAAQRGAASSTPSGPFSIPLPACIQSGDCKLTDVVATGAGFANFLLQIAGAVFLGIFVYGGFKYLTAGTSGRAAEGKKMIIQATVAMALLMAAFVFIQFVQQSLIGGRNPGQSEACTALSKPDVSYGCQFLTAPPGDSRAISEEITRRSCERNKCPGPANYVCCPQ